MKKLSAFLALLLLFFAGLSLAASSAVVTSVTGLAQVQSGGAAGRPLRQGDEVNQGDTVFTGANSSLVMKFDDGQVAALTSNSRMTVTNYQYNAGAESGNVLLSLITGGMRTITGLIGRRNPSNVAYRAATATIGIRGTDGTLVTNGTDVVVTVTEGSMTINYGGVSYLVTAGNAIFLRPGAAPVTGTIAQVTSQLPAGLSGPLAEATRLNSSIVNINPGQPRGNLQGDQGNQNGQGEQGQQGGPQGGGGNGGGAGGGGNGNASGS